MNSDKRRFGTGYRRQVGLWLPILAAAALIVRLALASRPGGFMSDQELFVDWMRQVSARGLGGVYIESTNINYPPLFLLIMDLYRRVIGWFGAVPAPGELSFKGVLVALDMAVFAAAARLTRNTGSPRRRLAVLGLLALNPALIFVGSVWGQVDLPHSFLMAASLILLPPLPAVSGVLFALALLTKFQAVTLLAVFGMKFLHSLIRKKEWRPAALFLGGFAGTVAVCAGFFALFGGLRAMIAGAYLSAVGMYPQVTMNAMNIWFYFVGTAPATPDTTKILGLLTLRGAGFLLLALCTAFAALYLWRSRMDAPALLKAAALVNFGFFMLPTEMHERYSIPALVLAIFVCLYDHRWRLPALVLSFSVTANLWMVQAGNIHAAGGLFIVYVHVGVLLWMMAALGLEIKRGEARSD
ncbi:hypothetical protein QWJ34_16150 [Saccharibacillus sp. CPCC 101409]|uniref:hypothetical protein n=1 Tax=Saccharibacillus sp. CPCC 101409 TaxID=3058041 RepID=UPI002672E25F|nr:hypothetical protein [Saccharibacillus sp. CPCC 101409]MDO3411298.1 hypothetical protein [Saccharibacillus sp. CPCC 101409]